MSKQEYKITKIKLVELGSYQIREVTGQYKLRKGKEPLVSNRTMKKRCFELLKLKIPKRYVMSVTTSCGNKFYFYP